MKSIDQFDLHRRRTTGARPVRSEILALLSDLQAEGVAPPAAALRAMQLLADTEALYVLPDVGAWLAGAHLDALDPAQVMDHLRADLADLGLHTGGGSNLFMQVHDALTARAAQAIVSDLDRLFDALRPAWDTSAAVVHAAAGLGITSASTAQHVIAMGDDQVAAWRALPEPIATLNRVHRLRNQLLFVAGRELGEGDIAEQRWLDRAAGGPPELTVTEVSWQQAHVQRLAPAATPDTTATDTDVADTDVADTEHQIDTDTSYREEATV